MLPENRRVPGAMRMPAADAERLTIAAAVAASVLLHAWALAMPRWAHQDALEPQTRLTVELTPQPLPAAADPPAAAVVAPDIPKPPPPKAAARRELPPTRVATPAPVPAARAVPAPAALAQPAAVPTESVATPPAAAAPTGSSAAPDSAPPGEAVERRASAAPYAAPATAPSYSAAYLRNPPPRYPPSARRNGEQGTVLLRVWVAADGTTTRTELARSSGSGTLDDAALAAVKNWRFVPARRGGEAVEGVVTVPLEFRLDAGG